MRTFTTVMYHYVRDTEQTLYPGLKTRSVSEFKGQLDYLERHYEFVKIEDIVACLDGDEERLPENGVLLTFDDGYLEHYETVFPLLRERGIQGVFFPPAKPVIERHVLDVNKIQFILGTEPNLQVLIDAVNAAVIDNQKEYSLNSPEEYWVNHANPYRYDSAEVIFFKRMLQVVLPLELRTKILADLFEAHITKNEKDFADGLYMNADHLREMKSAGMALGSHGDTHRWLNSLSQQEQHQEISTSLKFLQTLGVSVREWIICYPYGGYNDNLVELIQGLGCRIGFTVEPGISNLDEQNPLCLSRLDTNELPKTL
jgi:peptidoglycan/xylan/chitin deacetylase (PgdA/CDA1 family)